MLLMSTSLALLGVGIAPGAEFDGERGANQLEGVAEIALEVALVGVRNAVERVAMDDDARWIDAALVRIAQLRPDEAGLRWRLPFDRGDHGARDFWRRQTRHSGRVRPQYRSAYSGARRARTAPRSDRASCPVDRRR